MVPKSLFTFLFLSSMSSRFHAVLYIIASDLKPSSPYNQSFYSASFLHQGCVLFCKMFALIQQILQPWDILKLIIVNDVILKCTPCYIVGNAADSFAQLGPKTSIKFHRYIQSNWLARERLVVPMATFV